MPKDTPVTTPPLLIVAWLLLMLHTPPPAASVNGVNEPIHNVETPDIVPALTAEPDTVTGKLANAVPQLLLTV